MKYLSKYPLTTSETFEPLTLMKVKWTWNKSHQDLYDKAKNQETHMYEVLQ